MCGDRMRHLIIAKDKECTVYKILLSGTFEQISEYTTKFEKSDEIRKDNKTVVERFVSKYNDKGDIVIIDDDIPNIRFRVLYKKDIQAVKIMLQSHSFGISLVKSRRLKKFSEWNYRSIVYSTNTQYQDHIKKWLKSRKEHGDYFEVIAKIENYYDDFALKNQELPNRKDIYAVIKKSKEESIKKRKATLESKKREIQSLKELYSDESLISDTSEFFVQVYDSYIKGGIEEVLNFYSIDDLYTYLNDDELKILGLGGYHR